MHDELCLSDLTPKQCECLELVLQQLTSKQIALELGISPFTVNQRLDGARKKLNAATRQEAALKYARLRGMPESLAYHRPDSGQQDDALQVIKVSGLPERAVYQPFMLANEQGLVPNTERTERGPDLVLAEAPRSIPTGTDALLASDKSGLLRAMPAVFWRLSLVVAFAALIMVLILVGVAAGQGLSEIL